jgi:uncharacterized protein (TIGR02145 family)
MKLSWLFLSVCAVTTVSSMRATASAALHLPTPSPELLFEDGGALLEDCPSPLLIDLRVLLEGPYDEISGLMNDNLRSGGLLPTSEPYTALGYGHVGNGGGETASPPVFLTTGSDAVVDWVVVELRAATDPGRRIATRSALLQRDGDVRDVDNLTLVQFCVPAGEYFISVRHRNHLGIMSAEPILLDGTTSLDLSAPTTLAFRSDSRKRVGDVMTMWAGDVNFNGTIQYTGQDNDRDVILSTIGGVVPTATVAGFEQGDVDLNGVVQYTGNGNDRDRILQNIGGVIPTATRSGYLPKDSLALRTRVHVVDSIEWVLDTLASDLTDYSSLVYVVAGAMPDIEPWDIIVGVTGIGYMRKVTDVEFAGSIMTLQTTAAGLADIFLSGTAQMVIESEEDTVPQGFVESPMMAGLTAGTSFSFIEGPGVSVNLENVDVDVDYKFIATADFGADGLESAELAIRNASVQMSGRLVLDLNGSLPLVEQEVLVKRWIRLVIIGFTPFVVATDLKLKGRVAVQSSAGLTATKEMELGCVMDLGAKYVNGSWQNVSGLNGTAPSMDVEFNFENGAQITGSFGFEFETTVNLVAGPYFNAALGFTAEGAVSALDRDFTAGFDVVLQPGIRAKFLDLLQVDANMSSTFPVSVYESPGRIKSASDIERTGQPGQVLQQPVIVQVEDKFEPVFGEPAFYPAENYRVQFSITSGGGSVSPTEVQSNEEGFAQCSWTLGEEGEQRLIAFVLLSNGDTLAGGPIEFQATFEADGCAGDTAVTDIDGNVYPVVSIGNQCWMAANLKTTRYRDGSIIPNVTADTAWAWTEFTSDAWCNYNNSLANDALYGKLYNWYAASNSNICPQGWHVPTDEEWQQLELELGMPDGDLQTTFIRGEAQNVGGKVKSYMLWSAPNSGATNESGLSGLPSGSRNDFNGNFNSVGNYGQWWTASEQNADVSWLRSVGYDFAGVLRASNGKRTGYALRCIRD